MTRDVLLATRNAHKIAEIRGLLATVDVRLLSLVDVGVAQDAHEERVEVWDTFEANALAKASWFRGLTELPTLADDSGLCVDELEGRPGVFSRRFAPGAPPGGAEQDAANNAHLLTLLEGVPPERRTAHYRAALALVDDRFQVVVFGRCSGAIATEPKGEGGFGYDPLFLVPGTGKTFGELDPAVKAERSHRAAAARGIRPWLEPCPGPVHESGARSSPG